VKKRRSWLLAASVAFNGLSILAIAADVAMSNRAFAASAAAWICYMTWWGLDLRARKSGGGL
jgi:hypothetical protein